MLTRFSTEAVDMARKKTTEHTKRRTTLRTFDERNLVFLFQEHLNNRRPSNHFHFDSPEREAA
jgi:hypothetical protein